MLSCAGDHVTIPDRPDAKDGDPARPTDISTQQGLPRPRRHDVSGDRAYDSAGLHDAQTVALVRCGGYRLPAIADVLAALRRDRNPERARAALARRHEDLAARSEQRLAAVAALALSVALLWERASDDPGPTEPATGTA